MTGLLRKFLFTLVPAFLILSIIGAWFLIGQNRRVERDAIAVIEAIAGLKSEAIGSWRADQLVDAIDLTKSPFFRESVVTWLTGTTVDMPSTLLEYLQGSKQHYSYLDILIVDRSGAVRLSLADHSGILHEGALQHVQEVLDGGDPRITELHSGSGDLPVHLGVIAPIVDAKVPGNGVVGAIIIQQNAGQFLFPYIRSWPIPSETAESLLIRQVGTDVLFLNALRFRDDAALALRISMDDTSVPAVQAALGSVGAVEGLDYRGVPVIAVAVPVPDSPWYLIAKQDRSEVFVEIRANAWLLVILVLVILSGVGAIIGLTWRSREQEHFQSLYRSEVERRQGELQFATTLRSIGDAVLTTDAGGRVTFMNPVAEQLTGWSSEDAGGRTMDEIFPIINEDSREKVEDPVQRVLQDGEVVGLSNHTLLIARDGTETPIADSAAPVHDDEGRLTGVVLVFRDQSDERERQKALYESNKRFRLLYEQSPVPLQTLDVGGNLLSVNDAWLEALGYDRDEILGRNFSEFIPESQQEDFNHCFEQFTTAGEVHNKEVSIIHKDGSLIEVIFDGRIAQDAKGGFLQSHCVFTDITERKQIEEERLAIQNRLRSQVEILQYRSDTPGEFLEHALSEVIRLTGSRIGYIYHYDEETRRFTLHAWSKDVMKECTIREPRTVYDLDATGIWGEAVRQRQPIILNDFQAEHPLKKGYPEGHADLSRFLTVPVFNGEQIIAVVGVGNKPDEYAERDVLQLTLMMDSVFKVLDLQEAEVDRDQYQAALYQSQKMESVGLLAGGVAHDYNNMLGVIIGRAEMATMSLDQEHPVQKHISEILEAADRSAGLTRQLLAFARQQTIAPQVLDLNETISGMIKMMRRLIGEDIDLVWQPGYDLWPVNMDVTQINQLLANLMVNARDAIGGVGKVMIETENRTVDEEQTREHLGFIEGEYVVLAVSDDGCGIDPEHKERIFEPFYTTKEAGSGTGLGLSTVFGIIKQNNGFIYVYSEPEAGTTFRLYIPRFAGEENISDVRAEEYEPVGGSEHILLIEDEVTILELSVMILEGLGYHVQAAETPDEAIQMVQTASDQIDLLITDVVMPGMNGREVAEKIKGLLPEIRTLFISGYTADVIAHRGILEEDIHFLEKPFSRLGMAEKVREVLDGK